jgi:hypothetical protein
MPFEFPDPLPAKPNSKKPDEQLSKNTIRIYKSYLNKLAKQGFDTIDTLIERDAEVVKAIDASSDDNTKRRFFCSAIFFILYGNPYMSKPNAIYNYFQTIKTG